MVGLGSLSILFFIFPRPLVRCMEQHPSLLSLQRIGAWSLCNLCDGQPRPTVDVATVDTVSIILVVGIVKFSSIVHMQARIGNAPRDVFVRGRPGTLHFFRPRV